MIDYIAAAFNAEDATLDVMVSRGFGPDGLPSGADIENRIRNNKLVRVLVDVNPRPDMDIAQATRSNIMQGFAMMYCFAKSDSPAVSGLKDWWTTIAGDGGRILHNIEGKVTLGTVEFLHWRAVGGFQGFATKHGGSVWMCDQMVEYAARVLP